MPTITDRLLAVLDAARLMQERLKIITATTNRTIPTIAEAYEDSNPDAEQILRDYGMAIKDAAALTTDISDLIASEWTRTTMNVARNKYMRAHMQARRNQAQDLDLSEDDDDETDPPGYTPVNDAPERPKPTKPTAVKPPTDPKEPYLNPNSPRAEGGLLPDRIIGLGPKKSADGK